MYSRQKLIIFAETQFDTINWEYHHDCSRYGKTHARCGHATRHASSVRDEREQNHSQVLGQARRAQPQSCLHHCRSLSFRTNLRFILTRLLQLCRPTILPPELRRRLCSPPTRSLCSLRRGRRLPYRSLRRPAWPVVRRFVNRRWQKRRRASLSRAAGPPTPCYRNSPGGNGRGEQRALLDLFFRETILLVAQLMQVEAVRVLARRVAEVRGTVLGCAKIRSNLASFNPKAAHREERRSRRVS